MTSKDIVTITECPRDSFQGLQRFITTEEKIEYINGLIRTGFRRIDFGSFVSPKVVPQMADTSQVFENIQHTKDLYLIGIIGNQRGLEGLLACNGKLKHRGRIAAAGYPLSINETFQQRNLGRSMKQSWDDLGEIAARATDHGVDVICYLSMAFGNPYGDDYSPNMVVDAAGRLQEMGVGTVSLADTIGSAEPTLIEELFTSTLAACPDITITAHLHSTPDSMPPKLLAAVNAGCRMVDSAIGGIGGCPFAKDDLTGNVDTLKVIQTLNDAGYETTLRPQQALAMQAAAQRIASLYSREEHPERL